MTSRGILNDVSCNQKGEKKEKEKELMKKSSREKEAKNQFTKG
jgi:hypothetical protein